jgi:hypothetical protein
VEPVATLAEQEVEDGQVLTIPKMVACRQRLTHPIGARGEITTSVACINERGHDGQPHRSHPFKNSFSGEIEYLVWSEEGPDAKASFVINGFDQFTCKGCWRINEYHGVPEDCWECGKTNPPSNYDFDP